jgi:hypothetical protein
MWRGSTGNHLYKPAAIRSQKSAHKFRPQFRISKGRRNPNKLQLRAPQHQSQRKGVVDIVANIGIENDQIRLRHSLPGGLTLLPISSANCGKQKNQSGQPKKNSRIFHG